MGIHGRLSDMGLADIVQLFHIQRKTAAIRVGSGQGYGMVYMRGGKVVHATCPGLVGEDALYHLAGWSDGTFEVESAFASHEATIHADVESLLLESVKRSDEFGVVSQHKHGSFSDEDIDSPQLVKRLVDMGILKSISD
ncbi:MAG: DUF4388 domain-containing protein [Thermodesulfobacteriota bacterium]